MNKLGIQCQEKANAAYQYNQVVQPSSIKAINITDADFWQRIWDENPRLKYAIYREFPNGPEPWEDPEGTAAGWVNYLASKIRHLVDAGLVTHIEGHNEWLHSFQKDRFPAADRFMTTLIDKTHEAFEGKVHIIVLNASCGHFSDDVLEFPETLAKLNECGQCLLGLHEYDREDMDRLHREDIAGGGEGYWLVGKFLRVEQALKEAGYDNVPVALTEVGLDDAVQRSEGSHHWGWKHYGATTEEAVVHFLNEHNLAWFYPLLAQSEMTVLASIFGCGMYREDNWGEWGFDIADGFPALLNGIKNLETSSPPQPNGGNKMRVFDKDGIELFGSDAEQLVAYYGLEAEMPTGLQTGDHYFELTALREKVNTNAAFIFRVLDVGGNPIVNPDEALDRNRAHRAFWWPNMDPEANDIETHFSTDRQSSADLGGLNENGEGGSGMGTGAYWHPDDPDHPRGPHMAWVRHPIIPSVLLKYIGMRAGTNHDHMDAEWQEKVFSGEEPPPPDDPRAELLQIAERIEEIALSSFPEGMPTEMELTYPDGSKTRYTLAPTAQGLFARLWSAVKGR